MGGYKKPVSFSADERKLKLFPVLPDIIGTAYNDSQSKGNSSYKKRSDPTTNPVEILKGLTIHITASNPVVNV